MQQLLYLLVLTMICPGLFAQKNDFKPVVMESNQATDGEKSAIYRYVIGQGTEGIYYLGDRYPNKERKTSDVIIKVNNDLKGVTIKHLITAYKDNVMTVVNAKILGDRLFVFTSFYNKKLQQAFLFAHKYDASTLLPQGELKLISTIDNITDESDSKWFFSLSPDKKSLAIATQLFSERKEENRQVVVQLLTNTLDRISVRTIPVNRKKTLKSTLVGSNGTIYLSMTEELEGSTRKNKIYAYSLLAVPNNQDPPHNVDLALPGSKIRSSYYDWLDEKTLAASGSYRNADSNDQFDFTGVYLMTFDAETLTPKINTTVPLQYKKNTYGLHIAASEIKKEERLETRFRDFDIRSIDRIEDGSIYLTGSINYRVIRTSGGSLTSGGAIGGHDMAMAIKEDIRVIHLTATGQPDWVRTIPKKTAFGHVNTGSKKSANLVDGYKTAATNGFFYVIFNDHIENIENFNRYPVPLKKIGRNSLTRFLRYDSSGEVIETAVNNKRHKGSLMYCTGSALYDPSDNSFFMIVYKSNKPTFQRISF